MENIILKSDELLFCLTRIEDLDKIIEIENDEENSKYVFSWSKEKHMQAIESENWLHITIRTTHCEEIIGYIILDGVKSDHDTIELTRIVIDKKGQGYGRHSIKLVKKLCFELLGCHRLWLDAFDYNLMAIDLYKSEGFIQEGIIRDCRKVDGKYYSMCVFSMLENEYTPST